MRFTCLSKVRPLFTLLLVFLALELATADAQSAQLPSDPQVDSGTHSYGTYSGVHDNVSLASGNLSLCIPLVSLPGRNNHDLNIPLCYNSEFMEIVSSTTNVVPTKSVFPWVWGPNSAPMGPGWALTGRPIVYGSAQTTGSGLPVAFMADGSKYGFPGCGASVCGPDGSMADLYMENGQVLYEKDGTTVTQQANNGTQVHDTNGNVITFQNNSIVDAP